jgi:hypothetical protein
LGRITGYIIHPQQYFLPHPYEFDMNAKTHFFFLQFWFFQVEKMRSAGLIKGGSLENAMVCR